MSWARWRGRGRPGERRDGVAGVGTAPHPVRERIRLKFTPHYPFCSSFAHRSRKLAFSGFACFLLGRRGFEVGFLKRVWPLGFPTLRFRAKVLLGFAVVLTISAASMGIA